MIHKRTREAKQAMLCTFMETTIAQVAKEVFAERGYQQATLEEIAQRAGMSKATIYLYDKNKDDLFLHVVEKLAETTIAETAQAAGAHGTPLDKLARIVQGKMAFYEHEREFFRIYLNEKHGLEVASKDPHKRLLRDMYRQGVDMLACVLQEGMDTGVLRPMEPQRLAFFLQEMMSTVLGQRIQGKTRTSVAEDAAQLLDLFLHGARCQRERPHEPTRAATLSSHGPS
jgi:AcrR family transcriptional regulator